MAHEPVAHLAYTVTTADALAYEVLPREMVGWRRWAFLLWFAAAGIVLAVLPRDWVGPEGGWRFWLILLLLLAAAWGVAMLARWLAAHRRARRRIPSPKAVELRQWGDHLEVVETGRTFFVAYETIADVTLGKDHVFITAPPEVIIIPRGAFDSAEQMVAFGSEIDRLSSEAAP